MELETTPHNSGIEWEVEPSPWSGFGFLSKLIAISLPLLAAVTLILPYLDHSLLRRLARLPGLGGLMDWLINRNGSLLAGIALLLLWVAFLLFRRWRIVSNEHLWVDAGCPECREHELVRVSRERSDRWYGLLRIPAFRYVCRNCTFRGLRIARRHRHLVVAQEELITASSLTLDANGTIQAENVAAADVTTADVAHEDVAHEDVDHEDADHEDVAHEDVDHEDADHEDVAHQDVGHEDAGHEGAGHEDAAQGLETADTDVAATMIDTNDESEFFPPTNEAEGWVADATIVAPADDPTATTSDDDDLDWLWRKLSDAD